MKTKKILSCLFLIVITFIVLSSGYIIYLTSLEPCKQMWPVWPPVDLRFGSYYMITDQGPLFIGQTYNHRNEGPWVGNFTLLYLDNRGATFLVRYPQGTGSDFRVLKCKKYYPRALQNEAVE